MLRAALAIASVTSLLLAIAVAVLWPRSYLRWDNFWFQAGSREGGIHIADGVVVVFLHAPAGLTPGTKWRRVSSPANRNLFPNDALLELYDAPEHRRFPAISWATIRGVSFIGFPLALLMLPLLPVPVAWLTLRRRWRAARRRELGLCPACGYSLQGITSRHCPECGTATSRP